MARRRKPQRTNPSKTGYRCLTPAEKRPYQEEGSLSGPFKVRGGADLPCVYVLQDEGPTTNDMLWEDLLFIDYDLGFKVSLEERRRLVIRWLTRTELIGTPTVLFDGVPQAQENRAILKSVYTLSLDHWPWMREGIWEVQLDGRAYVALIVKAYYPTPRYDLRR